MQSVQLRDAKAHLSNLVDDAMAGQSTIITRHGKPQAVMVGFEEWERLSAVPSFAHILMSIPLDHDDVLERDETELGEIDL